MTKTKYDLYEENRILRRIADKLVHGEKLNKTQLTYIDQQIKKW